MDTSSSSFGFRFGRLIRFWLVLFACIATGNAFAGAMPAITPISATPTAGLPGGGFSANVTYQVGGAAANDAGAAAAANEAFYVSRSVPIAADTVGGMVGGAVAAGAEWVPWVAAAYAAYQVYKWYQDQQTGSLMQPGHNVPETDCGGGNGYGYGSSPTIYACTAPGIAHAVLSYWQQTNTAVGFALVSQSVSADRQTVTIVLNVLNKTSGAVVNQNTYFAGWVVSTPSGTEDVAYTTDPTPVTNQQLADLAAQHPDWWQQMLTDPHTGNVIITPEIAHDMDALKQQLAPQYGVDPTTLSATQPDPDYQHGVATPRQTDLPQYCQWASEACNYYKFVEDNWPNKEPNTYSDEGCDTPPPCSGDQVMCGVAHNTWVDRCAVGGDGTKPPQYGGHVVSELDGPDQTVGDPSQLDSSGFGFGTACPFTSQDIPFGSSGYYLDMGPVCEYGPWLRFILLGFCAWKCGEIVAGLRTSK